LSVDCGNTKETKEKQNVARHVVARSTQRKDNVSMNLDDEYVAIFVSRRQLITILEAIDAMIDDASQAWVDVSDDDIPTHRQVDVRDINVDDLCDDHFKGIASQRQRVDDLQSLFDNVLSSDEQLQTWGRNLIAVSLHELSHDEETTQTNNEGELHDNDE